MPDFLNLAEAARSLGMSEPELKRLAQDRKIRAFMDGGSWRFRKADIEEESRRRGMGSDPELPLSDLDLASPLDTNTGDEIDLSEFQIGVAGGDLGMPSISIPGTSGSDAELVVDERTLPPIESGSSSTIIGMAPTKGKRPSDSDVKLVPDFKTSKSASDSDVRLARKPPSDSDVTIAADGSSQEVLPVVADDGVDPNATLLAPSPVLGSSEPEVRSIDGSSDSDFELTPSSVIDALEPESGSDFELTALDQSDEFESAPTLRKPGDSDVTGARASTSGVNLSKPSDSGVNLQSVGGFDLDSAESIELAPMDDEDDEPARPAPKPAAKPAAARKPEKVDLSATALPSRDEKVDLSATALPIKSEKDIFEDTDFDVDVDAIEGGSSDEDRTVQLDARSDFDVEESSVDSASEVFAVDEEDVDANAATAMGPSAFAEEPEDISGENESAWDVEEVAPTPSTASRSMASPLVASAGPGPEWGGLWVGLLAVATILMLLLAFVGLDLVRNLYYFQGDTPASGLITQIAGLIGG